MYVILWRYRVAAAERAAFQHCYGETGDWVRLFRRDGAYQGSRLLQDANAPEHYLTIDYWDSRTAYEHFLHRHAEAYQALDRRCAGLSLEQTELGRYLHPV